ncbi:serine/threonine-protein kinase [Merismopedia glauca]|nr:serine/threonine-protein kinase [Merismopedia glauca]
MKVKSRYHLLKLLNSDALSKTFLAVDEGEEIPQKCVTKQLKISSQNLVNFELTESEKLTIQRINQSGFFPNIIDVFLENERLYIVTEFIEGVNLEEILENQGVFNESQLWRSLNELLPALNWLHESNLIHQNIKPTNIIRTNINNRYRLLDINLSQLLPQTFSKLGLNSFLSAEYSAPEQLKGEAVFASDLYSLGVICIHLLTGVTPFELFDAANNCWIWQDYLPTKTSGDFERVINKLIANDRARRFSSATEILKAINPDPLAYLVAKPQDRSVKSEAGKWEGVETLYLVKSGSGSINSVALNPQGNITAAARDDKNIELWNLTSKSQISTLVGHKSAVRAVAFSLDGKAIASGSDDKTVKLWNVETGKEIITLTGHTNSIRSVVYSPCGNFLASGSWDKTIKLWQVDNFREICTIPGHKLQVNAVDFSPDGKLLASASCDRTVNLWDISSLDAPKLVSKLTKHLWAVLAIAFHPHQAILATASDDKTINLWNYETNQLINTISAHSWSVVSLAFTPDGSTLISGSLDSKIKLWLVNTGAEIATLLGHTDAVHSICVSLDSQTIISGSKDQNIKLWQHLN